MTIFEQHISHQTPLESITDEEENLIEEIKVNKSKPFVPSSIGRGLPLMSLGSLQAVKLRKSVPNQVSNNVFVIQIQNWFQGAIDQAPSDSAETPSKPRTGIENPAMGLGNILRNAGAIGPGMLRPSGLRTTQPAVAIDSALPSPNPEPVVRCIDANDQCSHLFVVRYRGSPQNSGQFCAFPKRPRKPGWASSTRKLFPDLFIQVIPSSTESTQSQDELTTSSVVHT